MDTATRTAPPREEVRQRDFQPLNDQELLHIMQLRIEAALSGGQDKLISAHERFWKAMFPRHVAAHIWWENMPAELRVYQTPAYVSR